jgi:hypothetical protein
MAATGTVARLPASRDVRLRLRQVSHAIASLRTVHRSCHTLLSFRATVVFLLSSLHHSTALHYTPHPHMAHALPHPRVGLNIEGQEP